MLYYPLKNLRRDPHIFFKIVLFCIVAHVLILIFPLMKSLVHPPKKMATISFMPRSKGANVTFKGNKKSLVSNKHTKSLPAKTKSIAAQKQTVKPDAKKHEQKAAVKNVATKNAAKIADGSKAKLPVPSIEAGASSKLAIKKKVVKKNVAPKVATRPIAVPKEKQIKKIEPIAPIKEPVKEVIKLIDPPVQAQPVKALVVLPELQSMALDAGISPNNADEKNVPEWFTKVRDEISYKILEYKFFKDIEDNFSYTALITINAQGKASISDEAGCAIPVVRSSIKKIYLEYAYPKTMWNKIWPISIEKQKLFY